MRLPRITVVMPSFNQVDFIEESIRSILDQNYPSLDFLIIDGGSTDGSVEIIKQFENNLAYWQSKPDKGQTDAIIQGLERAKGNILTWINSDDILLPNTLWNVAQLYDDRNKYVIFSGNYILIDQDSRIIRCKRHPKQSGWFGKNGLQIVNPGWFFTQELYHEVNGLNVDFNYAMDAHLYFRMIMHGATQKHINSNILGFRIHETSKTGSQKKRFYEEAKKIAQMLRVEYRVTYHPLNNISGLWREEFGAQSKFALLPLIYKLLQVVNGNYLHMCIDTVKYRNIPIQEYAKKTK